MADGKTHALAAGAGVAVATGAAYWFYGVGLPQFGIATVTGALMGFLMTPDLDLEGKTEEERRLRAIPIFGFLWQWFWYGYAMIFRHRGMSHWYVVGTATRLTYLVILWTVATLLALGVGAVLALTGTIVFENLVVLLTPWAWLVEIMLLAPWACLWFFTVWCMQDAVHILMDTKTFKYMSRNAWVFVLIGGIAICVWLVVRR